MPSEPLKILAVDDVRENLVALEAALDQPGVELVTARSGFEALEMLLRDDFALALLDVQMPEMDGFELAELMRGTERTKGVPIIFLTAVATDERRRFRGFEAGAVDYLLKPLDITILNSKVAVFVELARQRREIARQRDELGAALGRLRSHGDNSPLGVLEIDGDLRIVGWFQGAERTIGHTARDMLGKTLDEVPFLAEDDRASFITDMRALLEGSTRREMVEHRFMRADGTMREGEWYCSSLNLGPRRNASVMIEILDSTERKRALETQRLLIGELNHRVKNTLATVQAIASQGARHASTTASFHEAFTGRLQALSRAHSMLSATTWESASLRALIAEGAAFDAGWGDRVRMEGEDIHLPPEMALRLALILHELATNAQKYGALSNAGGHVAISWTCREGLLALDWVERGGPEVEVSGRRGFGSTLIESSMAADGADIASTFAPEGVTWNLRIPASCEECRAEAPEKLKDRAKEALEAPAPCERDRSPQAGSGDAASGVAETALSPTISAPCECQQCAPAEPGMSRSGEIEIASIAGDAPPAAVAPEQQEERAMPEAAESQTEADRSGPVRILVVEDEPLVAMELMMEIEDNGGLPIGPATSCEQALQLIREGGPDLALLDGNLNGERIDPVADCLAERSTPFAFVSGYGREHLPQLHAGRPMLGKPFLSSEVIEMLRQLSREANRELG